MYVRGKCFGSLFAVSKHKTVGMNAEPRLICVMSTFLRYIAARIPAVIEISDISTQHSQHYSKLNPEIDRETEVLERRKNVISEEK